MTKLIVIIGAGFTGATIARMCADAGHSVMVFEERDHVAGNAYDYVDENSGARVHAYGPHLFHTNNTKVVDFLSRFTEWTEYKHKVKALYDGKYLTLPVNRATRDYVGDKNVLDIFFRPYTRKMWGMELDELNPDIINRIPMRDDDNELYFPNDTFQAMPTAGYTALVNNMLDHPNIEVTLNYAVTQRHIRKLVRFTEIDVHVFNCAPIDEWYRNEFGPLPYRSIKFHHAINKRDMVADLPTATVNFTDDKLFTRVTQWDNIPGHGDKTSDLVHWTYEEPCDYRDNNHERFYPVKDIDGKNMKLHRKYLEHAKEVDPYMTFVGRCGSYVYIDMHQAVNMGMQHAQKFLENKE